MRKTFLATLCQLAEQDERIVLLTGDLGYTVLEPFAERFPARFFNVGVAEQNMIGLATGLAEAGLLPFAYSIATFAALRGYEFIRNGPVLHHLPVRIVGVGGGFEYGSAGPTHHALEDLAIMRAQHGLSVIAPADFAQARAALLASWDLPGPVYYRLGKNDSTRMPGLDGAFELGRVQRIGSGADLVFVTTGAIATEVADAAELLRAEGIAVSIIVVAALSPPPVHHLVELLGQFSLAISVEAHHVVGGVGSLVAEVIAEHALSCRLLRCGVRAPGTGRSGSQAFLEARHGIARDSIVATARQAVALPSAAVTQ